MNYYLKKTYLLSIISMLIFGCSSSDDSTNSNLLLKEFIEPNLNFGIPNQELLNSEGVPDETIGTTYYYNSEIDGIINYVYVILPEFGIGYEIYYQNNVNIYEHQQNLDFLLNWFTNKYGQPEFIEMSDDTNSTYQWYINETFFIDLNFPRAGLNSKDNSGLNDLFISYTYNPI